MKRKIYLFSFICFIIDFISKCLVLNIKYDIVVITNFFSISLVRNTGAAFSSFEGYTYVLVFISILVLFYLFRYSVNRVSSNLEIVSYSLLIGGIFGNMFDRIIYGSVVDFLSFNIFGYSFPIFNFADIFICFGVLLIIIDMIRGGCNEISCGK